LHVIRLLILDVDGVLTDGRLVMAESGEVTKRFHVLDGAGVRLWRESGRQVAILTARTSPVVSRRAAELGIEVVHQGSEDKLSGYEAICRKMDVADAEVCYVGDDILDLAAMRRSGYPVAVANACSEAKRIASYVTVCTGGTGAVREVVRHLLNRSGEWVGLLTGYGL